MTTRSITSPASPTPRPPRNAPGPFVVLTDREEVALTVARDRTNAEIADELHISLSTAEVHLASLTTKIGARNRVQVAIRLAKRSGCGPEHRGRYT